MLFEKRILHGRLLMDGGIRRGSDIVKAMAPGARGCLNEARLKSHDPVFAAVEHLDLVFCSEHTRCQHQGGD